MKRGHHSGIARLAPSTNVMDCHKLVGEYVKGLVGYQYRSSVKQLEIWVRREKGQVVAVGPTAESVTTPIVIDSMT